MGGSAGPQLVQLDANISELDATSPLRRIMQDRTGIPTRNYQDSILLDLRELVMIVRSECCQAVKELLNQRVLQL